MQGAGILQEIAGAIAVAHRHGMLAMGPWRSRWRILVGALGGLALGSHLLIDLNLVPKSQFTIGLGLVGLLASAATYVYLWIAPRTKRRRLLSRDTG